MRDIFYVCLFFQQQFQARPDESPCHEYNFKIESHTAFLDALKTALRTSAHSFVLRFVESNGLSALLEILRLLDIRVANSPMHSSLIGCLKALMNNSVSEIFLMKPPKNLFTHCTIITYFFLLYLDGTSPCIGASNKY